MPIARHFCRATPLRLLFHAASRLFRLRHVAMFDTPDYLSLMPIA